MDDCLRINKPCKFEGLAKNWPAYEKWKFGDNGYDYLKEKFDKQQIAVYVDMEQNDGYYFSRLALDSFKEDKMTLMRYDEFLNKMSKNAYGVTMKEADARTYDKLKEDVVNPTFLQDISDFYKLEIM